MLPTGEPTRPGWDPGGLSPRPLDELPQPGCPGLKRKNLWEEKKQEPGRKGRGGILRLRRARPLRPIEMAIFTPFKTGSNGN